MWSLAYSNGSHGFGDVYVEAVEIGGRVYRNDDVPAPRADGVVFGEDFADPGDVILHVAVDAPWAEEGERRAFVYGAAQQFSELWDAASVRSVPGAVAELAAGELGVFEGRPRSVEWDFQHYSAGFLRGKARFVRSSSVAYAAGASWRSVSVQLVPPEVGAWVFPLTFPVSGTTAVVRASTFEVGGTASAWPVIEVDGPVQSGASVEVTGEWSVTLSRGLAYDETARLDTRPGRRGMTVNGSPVNLLVPSSPSLADLSLSPGPHQVALRGSSLEGTAVARLRWRDTKAGV